MKILSKELCPTPPFFHQQTDGQHTYALHIRPIVKMTWAGRVQPYQELETFHIHEAFKIFEGVLTPFANAQVFTDVTPEMKIWKEEIFGPVLAVRSHFITCSPRAPTPLLEPLIPDTLISDP